MGVVIFIVIAVIIVWKVVPPIIEEKKFRKLVEGAYAGDVDAIHRLAWRFKMPMPFEKSKSMISYAGKFGALNEMENKARAAVLYSLEHKCRGYSGISAEASSIGVDVGELSLELVELMFSKYNNRSKAIEAVLDIVLSHKFSI